VVLFVVLYLIPWSHLHLFDFFFFYWSGDHRDLHSFPTRRSSDLFYQVYSGKEKSWVTFPVIDLTNSQSTTHVENPYLPPNVFVDNETTTEDLSFESVSVYAGVYGGSGIQRDVSAWSFSVYFALFTSVGVFAAPFAVFHNKLTYQGKDNKIEDILGITKYLERTNKLPKNLIVGVDFYILNKDISANIYFLTNK